MCWSQYYKHIISSAYNPWTNYVVGLVKYFESIPHHIFQHKNISEVSPQPVRGFCTSPDLSSLTSELQTSLLTLVCTSCLPLDPCACFRHPWTLLHTCGLLPVLLRW